MKRIVLAVLVSSLALLATAPAWAAGPLEFGIKAGLTSSTITGAVSEANDLQANSDVTGGIMLALSLPALPVSLQGEALFVTKGADIPRAVGKDVVRFRDIEFPVLARVSLPLGMPIKPFVVAGPSFAYNIDATIDPADPGLPKTDLKDVRKLDTGFALGAGARFSVLGIGATLEGRYNSSLTDVQENSNNAIPGKNAVYTFMVGVVF
jgi:hypothetical protein